MATTCARGSSNPRVMAGKKRLATSMTCGSISASVTDSTSRCLSDLPQASAVAASDDEHAPRRRVDGHGHVDEHLVVEELVPLRELHHAVQREHSPEERVLQDLDALVGALLTVELAGVRVAVLERGEGVLLSKDGPRHASPGRSAESWRR